MPAVRTVWEDGEPGRRLLVERKEAERELEKLTEDQYADLEDAYKGDEWAFGRKARSLHAEAVRRGWLLGPA